MTKIQASYVANLIALVTHAQEKGAFKLGDAKAAIIAIDALSPDLDRLLNGAPEDEAIAA